MKMSVVLQLDIHDDVKCKRRVMKLVSTVSGIDSISVDTKERKVTITGVMDPIGLVHKLRKAYHTEVVSIGPVKEPEKKKDESKDEAQMEFYCNGFPAYPGYYPYYF